MKNIKTKLRYGIVVLMLVISATVLAGCGADSKEGETTADEELVDNASIEDEAIKSAMQEAEAVAANQQAIANAEAMAENAASSQEAPAPTGITSADVLADPSLKKNDVNANIPDYIEVDRNNNGAISSGNNANQNNNQNNAVDTPIPSNGTKNIKETTPQFFDMGDCMVEVGGDYSTPNCDVIIAKVNELRAAYNIPACTKNTGLCKVADRRVKELKYFWGPIRPDGSLWNSIAPEYYKAECMVCTTALGGVNKACDGIISGTISRANIMNEEFGSIGASYFQSGDLVYVVVALGY